MQKNATVCARCPNNIEKAAIFVKIVRRKPSIRASTSSSSSTKEKFSIGPDISQSSTSPSAAAEKNAAVRRNWLSWHRSCFRCINCKTNLFAGEFQLKTNDSTTAAAHFCPECWVKMYTKQCAGCVTPLTDKGLLAMDVLWHQDCFRCSNCMAKMTDYWYGQDTEPKKPTCYECMVRPPDEEKLCQLRLLNLPPKTQRRRKKKRRNKTRRGGNVIDNKNGSHFKNYNLSGSTGGRQKKENRDEFKSLQKI